MYQSAFQDAFHAYCYILPSIYHPSFGRYLFRILCLSSFFPLLNSSSSSPLKRKSPTRQHLNYSIASCYFQSLATILVRTRSNFIKLAPCRKYIPQTPCALRACASQHKGTNGQFGCLSIDSILLMPILLYSAASRIVKTIFKCMGTLSIMRGSHPWYNFSDILCSSCCFIAAQNEGNTSRFSLCSPTTGPFLALSSTAY